MSDQAETVLIAQRIKWWRLDRKLSQQVVADRAGISRSYLTKIESGAARLDSRSTVEEIAGALGVSYADLTGQPTQPQALDAADRSGEWPDLLADAVVLEVGLRSMEGGEGAFC